MKQKTIITLVAILAIAGAISYGIIWYRNKKALASIAPVTPATGTQTTGTPVTGTGYGLPPINSYAWWLNKLGHASFPLGRGSVGVEVYKVQEEMNKMVIARKLTAGAITEDGIFGSKTEGRFALLFPGYSVITQFMFINEFDKNKEILK
ncbi:MAG: hypothetical protein Q8R96_11710 [Bacteroidota bacterium]|nr:hypothetical protein [Bacteroidota bacterium]